MKVHSTFFFGVVLLVTHSRTERGAETKRNRQREVEKERDKRERKKPVLTHELQCARSTHRTGQHQLRNLWKKKKTERVKEGVAASLFISSQRGARKFVAVMQAAPREEHNSHMLLGPVDGDACSGQTRFAEVLSDDW